MALTRQTRGRSLPSSLARSSGSSFAERSAKHGTCGPFAIELQGTWRQCSVDSIDLRLPDNHPIPARPLIPLRVIRGSTTLLESLCAIRFLTFAGVLTMLRPASASIVNFQCGSPIRSTLRDVGASRSRRCTAFDVPRSIWRLSLRAGAMSPAISLQPVGSAIKHGTDQERCVRRPGMSSM